MHLFLFFLITKDQLVVNGFVHWSQQGKAKSATSVFVSRRMATQAGKDVEAYNTIFSSAIEISDSYVRNNALTGT